MFEQANEMRRQAREFLKEGMWDKAALFTFVYFLIVTILGNSSSFAGMLLGSATTATIVTQSAGFIIMIVLYPISYGFYVAFLDFVRGRESFKFEFSYLWRYYSDFLRVALTAFLMVVYVMLWMLLLIVPGIIKALAYAMVPYILRDYPSLEYDAVISMSSKMMKGHKWELFKLGLSFIGWCILAILTLGIGFFWVIPYIQTAQACFYLKIKEQYELSLQAEG